MHDLGPQCRDLGRELAAGVALVTDDRRASVEVGVHRGFLVDDVEDTADFRPAPVGPYRHDQSRGINHLRRVGADERRSSAWTSPARFLERNLPGREDVDTVAHAQGEVDALLDEEQGSSLAPIAV